MGRSSGGGGRSGRIARLNNRRASLLNQHKAINSQLRGTPFGTGNDNPLRAARGAIAKQINDIDIQLGRLGQA